MEVIGFVGGVCPQLNRGAAKVLSRYSQDSVGIDNRVNFWSVAAIELWCG